MSNKFIHSFIHSFIYIFDKLTDTADSISLGTCSLGSSTPVLTLCLGVAGSILAGATDTWIIWKPEQSMNGLKCV